MIRGEDRQIKFRSQGFLTLGASMDWFKALLKKKKILILLVIFLLIIAFVLYLYFFYYRPKISNCLFENKSICLTGKKYEKYNWQGELVARAFNFNESQKIKAPFDGRFSYTPIAYINFEGKTKGQLSTLTFRNEKEQVRLYSNKINLLKGQAGVVEKVEKGEIVAEIVPEAIEFLDNYDLIMAVLAKQ